MLYVRHMKPISDHMSGKWVTNANIVCFYTIINNKNKEVTLTDEIRNFILSITIANPAVKGMYDRRLDSLIYSCDLESNNLEIEEIKTMTNVYFVRKKL